MRSGMSNHGVLNTILSIKSHQSLKLLPESVRKTTVQGKTSTEKHLRNPNRRTDLRGTWGEKLAAHQICQHMGQRSRQNTSLRFHIGKGNCKATLKSAPKISDKNY